MTDTTEQTTATTTDTAPVATTDIKNVETSDTTWTEKQKELQLELDNGNKGQLVYYSGRIGADQIDCLPAIFIGQVKKTAYPIVVEAPEGLTNPVYDWNKFTWAEKDGSALSTQVQALSQQVEALKQDNTTQTTNNDKLQQVLQGIQTGQVQLTNMLMSMQQSVHTPTQASEAPATSTSESEGSNK